MSNEDKWKQQLSSSEYDICRNRGTERAFTGEYWNHKEQGEYLCKCCGTSLFSSDDKYDSGSGWPSFFRPSVPTSIEAQEDYSHGMIRTEVHCQKCGCHLGHLFPDGPAPTGLRYCVNSASLQFKKG